MISKNSALKIAATAVSVLPPLFAGLYCFPLWLEAGREKSISGICIFMALLICLPFIRQIKDYFRSPSAPVLWLIAALSLTLIKNVIDDMLIISYVALASNTLGSMIFALGREKK